MDKTTYQDTYCCVCGGPFHEEGYHLPFLSPMPEEYSMPKWLYESSCIKFLGSSDWDGEEYGDDMGSTASGYVNTSFVIIAIKTS